MRHTLPGERVRARVTRPRAATASGSSAADAVEVARRRRPTGSRRPARIAGPGRCGGCDFQHAALPHQRALKAEVVREQFQRLAAPRGRRRRSSRCPATTDGLDWRTRVEFAVDARGPAGLRRHRSHDVVARRRLPASPTSGSSTAGVLERPLARRRGRRRRRPPAASRSPCRASSPLPGRARARRTVDRAASTTGDVVGRVPVVGPRLLAGPPGRRPRPSSPTCCEPLGRAAGGARARPLCRASACSRRPSPTRSGPTGPVLAVESDTGAAGRPANLPTANTACCRRRRRVRAGAARHASTSGVAAAQCVRSARCRRRPRRPRPAAHRRRPRHVRATSRRCVRASSSTSPATRRRWRATSAYLGPTGLPPRRSLRAFDAFPMTHHVECVARPRPVAIEPTSVSARPGCGSTSRVQTAAFGSPTCSSRGEA